MQRQVLSTTGSYNTEFGNTGNAHPVDWASVEENHDVIVIYAGGPSLANFNYWTIEGLATIIAVNRAAEFLTFADYFMTVDTTNFRRRTRLPSFKGKKYAAVPEDFGSSTTRFKCDSIVPPKDVHYLRRLDIDTLSDCPRCIGCGANSAFGAFNLAYHMKPKIVYLFGVDLHEDPYHWYGGRHITKGAMTRGAEAFNGLKHLQFEVINASPDSAVAVFDKLTPQDALRHLRNRAA